jgi:AraC family ethanolamine operon transcriptional activator
MSTVREPSAGTISSIPLPVAFKMVTRDVDDLARLYPDWKGQFQQVSAGRFQGTVQVARGQLVRVFQGAADQVLLTRGASQPGWIDFSLVTTRNQHCRWQGRQYDANHVVVRGAQVGVDNLAARGAEIINLSLPIELIRRAAAYSIRLNGDPARIDWQCHCVEPTMLAAVEELAKRFIESGVSDLGYPSASECYAIEQDLVLAALEVITSQMGSATKELRRNRRELISRGLDYLHAHLAEPVGLIDLCEVLGVSARTLQYAFRDRFGIGPIEYLRMLRLHAVRADLKTAREQGLGVREVAHRWGYHHLGNFAADFKRHFRVLPSKTCVGAIDQ